MDESHNEDEGGLMGYFMIFEPVGDFCRPGETDVKTCGEIARPLALWCLTVDWLGGRPRWTFSSINVENGGGKRDLANTCKYRTIPRDLM